MENSFEVGNGADKKGVVATTNTREESRRCYRRKKKKKKRNYFNEGRKNLPKRRAKGGEENLRREICSGGRKNPCCRVAFKRGKGLRMWNKIGEEKTSFTDVSPAKKT